MVSLEQTSFTWLLIQERRKASFSQGSIIKNKWTSQWEGTLTPFTDFPKAETVELWWQLNPNSLLHFYQEGKNCSFSLMETERRNIHLKNIECSRTCRLCLVGTCNICWEIYAQELYKELFPPPFTDKEIHREWD